MEVIAVIAIAGVLAVGLGVGGTYYQKWSDACAAGAALKVVRQAQIDFLADHPTASVADLAGQYRNDFIASLPGGQLPDLPNFDHQPATIDFSVQPPVARGSGGIITYGKEDDGLWDAGK